MKIAIMIIVSAIIGATVAYTMAKNDLCEYKGGKLVLFTCVNSEILIDI